MIQSLTLKNFGQFSELHLDFRGPMVGLMGPNGSGKSTVLQAIRFACAGYLEDTAESYITDLDPEKKAEVIMRFHKMGKQCQIERVIGKRQTRKLTVEGLDKPLTSAESVDAMMSSMWGGSVKSAMLYGVFIPQGELDKILFGIQSEREQLFVKLMGLSHCSSVCATIDQVIAETKIGIVDNSTVIDELTVSYNQSQRTIADLSAQLINTPDLRQVRRIAASMSAHVSWVDSSASMRAQLTNQLQEANTVLAGYQMSVGKKSAAEVETVGKVQAEELAQVQKQHDDLRMHTERLDTLLKANAALGSAKSNLANSPTPATTSIEDLQAQIFTLRNDAAYLHALRTQHAQITAQRDSVKRMHEALTALKEELEKHNSATPDKSQLAELTQKSELLSLSANLLSARLSSHVHTEKCPACGSAAPDPEFCTPENLTRIRADLVAVNQQINKINRDAEAHTVRANALGNRIAADQASLTAAESAYRTATTTWTERAERAGNTSPEELEAAYTEASTKADALAHQLTEVRANQQRIAELQRAVDIATANATAARNAVVIIESEINVESLNNSLTRIAQLKDEIAARTDAINAWRGWYTHFRNAEQNIATFHNQLQHHEALMADAHTQRATIQQQIDTTPLAVETLTSGGQWREITAELLADIDNNISTFTAITAQGAQTTQLRDQTLRRMQELEAQQRATDSKREAVRQLTELRTAMDRKGIPMLYVKYRFDQIARLTQMFLQDMGSNFSVEADTERNVTFRFFRSDKPGVGSAVLPQGKLSGGQRVRLCVAFLLAVQRLINPDTGLLVLDEPSMHLDDRAKEALRDLLESMAERMNNADTQIIVADHDETIKTALTSLCMLQA